MTIVDRALELVAGHALLGLGSGRAAQAFVRALGERGRTHGWKVRGVPTSEATAALAASVGIALTTLAEAETLDATIDGADEVDPQLDLIKGYGRALVREKIVASSSKRLIILVGEEKLVPRLGTRGRLPVEVVPFGLPLCARRLQEMGCQPVTFHKDGRVFVTDNGNHILDCQIGALANPRQFEAEVRTIPGVVDTGLFLGMADTVLVGDPHSFDLHQERQRPGATAQKRQEERP